jgi:hypothetical protein
MMPCFGRLQCTKQNKLPSLINKCWVMVKWQLCWEVTWIENGGWDWLICYDALEFCGWFFLQYLCSWCAWFHTMVKNAKCFRTQVLGFYVKTFWVQARHTKGPLGTQWTKKALGELDWMRTFIHHKWMKVLQRKMDHWPWEHDGDKLFNERGKNLRNHLLTFLL